MKSIYNNLSNDEILKLNDKTGEVPIEVLQEVYVQDCKWQFFLVGTPILFIFSLFVLMFAGLFGLFLVGLLIFHLLS